MKKNPLCKTCYLKGRKAEYMKDDEFGCGLVHWTVCSTHCPILLQRAVNGMKMDYEGLKFPLREEK